jgi:hypothetical protein
MSIYVHSDVLSMSQDSIKCLEKAKILTSPNFSKATDEQCIMAIVSLLGHHGLADPIRKLIINLRDNEFFIFILLEEDSSLVNDLKTERVDKFAITVEDFKTFFNPLDDIISIINKLEIEFVEGIKIFTNPVYEKPLDKRQFRKKIKKMILKHKNEGVLSA